MAHFSRLFKVVIDVPAGDYDRELSFPGQGERPARPRRGLLELDGWESWIQRHRRCTSWARRCAGPGRPRG